MPNHTVPSFYTKHGQITILSETAMWCQITQIWYGVVTYTTSQLYLQLCKYPASPNAWSIYAQLEGSSNGSKRKNKWEEYHRGKKYECMNMYYPIVLIKTCSAAATLAQRERERERERD